MNLAGPPLPAPPLRVLCSAPVLARVGPQLAAWGPAVQPVSLDDALAMADPAVHVALISRDVTGRSGKFEPTPLLAACWAALRRSSCLQWVHSHSAGSDRPIYAELMARGVRVSTSSGANAGVVAQTALAGLLALWRRLPVLLAAQAQRRWVPQIEELRPRELTGQTAVLVGWGPIGQALHTLLTALGLHTVVVRHRPVPGAPAAPGVPTVAYTALPQVLPQADWLLLACPLTDATRGLVDAAALAALPPGAQLVNVARGEVVVEADLVAALQAGRLAGAFLDVFEHEPLPESSPLWGLPGVIVSPHSAGQSDGHAARVEQLFLDNLARWLRGEPLHNQAGPSPWTSPG